MWLGVAPSTSNIQKGKGQLTFLNIVKKSSEPALIIIIVFYSGINHYWTFQVFTWLKIETNTR